MSNSRKKFAWQIGIGLLFAAFFASKAHAAGAAVVNSLELWTRLPGGYGDNQNPDKGPVVVLDPETLDVGRRTMKDVQYDKLVTLRGVSLKAVIGRYKKRGSSDLALLHFANGMIIPVSLTDGSLDKLNAFLALGVCDKPKSCTKDFPTVGKQDVYSVTDDPRPITFGWNKVAVAAPYHPAVPSKRAAIFSPWRHVDSLLGIEFVQATAYYAQFAFGEPAGLAVFQERCQFCHGVRYVGAQYGWDFVTPLPIYEKRQPGSLLNHVKYPKSRAKEMGLMMPNQEDVTLPEMQAIWRWMRNAAEKKQLPSYKP